MSKLSLFCAGALAVATPAAAQTPNMGTLAIDCLFHPCIYDSHGKLVGLSQATVAPFGLALRPMNNTWYGVIFYQSGLDQEYTHFFYSGAGCTGQTYLQPNYSGNAIPPFTLPQTAYFDGQSIWGAVGPMVNVPVKSELEDGICYSVSETLYLLPAAKVDTTVFYPPFMVK